MTATTTMLTIRPLTGALGAEVDGVDLASEFSEETNRELRAALNQYGVLTFRDQDLDAESLLGFAGRFGEIEMPLVTPTAEQVPGIMVLDKMQGDKYTEAWHTDQTYIPVPPMAAMLYATHVPGSGGDTCFSSMSEAFAALSQPMQEFLSTLTAVHSTARIIGLQDDNFKFATPSLTEAVHPVVRRHPETGRNLLFVNPVYTARIVELTEAEGNALLRLLFEHVQQVKFQCRVRWAPRTLTMWDERSTQHAAVSDYSGRRRLLRCMVAGAEPPTGPATDR